MEDRMKKIIIRENDTESISFDQIDQSRPIFAKKGSTLCGMLVKDSKGWILRTGSDHGANGFHDTLRECIASCIPYGYTFYVE
jgi:hypothetical protein